ncbi:hypothetical protein BST28_18570 [Mycolicibacter kumamotonensis]|uniref:Uncharacterized protein n=1 Tax=Mycolicibacter kumamotonensis TaxID=354243 RepID=A0A1X0DZQ3_9MYCO|nr:hypothetical protein [Mycolicibacter kumamotonensis]ORA77270.1 hypothetical protein BST28_18570 [Mycolicibacter kumamotonensis]
MIDMTPETDMDKLAEIAAGLHERMVDSPERLRAELVGLWSKHPVRAAQLTMCLVAWFDPDTPCSELWRRVELTVKQCAS